MSAQNLVNKVQSPNMGDTLNFVYKQHDLKLLVLKLMLKVKFVVYKSDLRNSALKQC